MAKTIGNPLSWTARLFERGSRFIGDGTEEMGGIDQRPIELRDITTADLREALRAGFDDFLHLRTDVIFIVLVYPVIGLALTWIAFNRDLLPLIFPLISGFALLGPVAAIGLYELSRRREREEATHWNSAFKIIESPSLIPILALAFFLTVTFLIWIGVALSLYAVTLGPEPPASLLAFMGDIFSTGAGWTMLIVGSGIGFVLAAMVLAMTIISFPLLIDRRVGLPVAVATSLEVSRRNPTTVAAWGAIVVILLGLSVLTLFLGMVVALPVLGHATWHLYRRAVVRPT